MDVRTTAPKAQNLQVRSLEALVTTGFATAYIRVEGIFTDLFHLGQRSAGLEHLQGLGFRVWG